MLGANNKPLLFSSRKGKPPFMCAIKCYWDLHVCFGHVIIMKRKGKKKFNAIVTSSAPLATICEYKGLDFASIGHEN